MMKAQLKKLGITELHIFEQDARSRIKSHSAGGYPDEYYIQSQQVIVDLVQEELRNRGA